MSLEASWRIPSGATDGVYSVRIHPNGSEEHTRIGDNPQLFKPKFPRPPRSNNIQQRDWVIDCYPDEGLEDLDHRTMDLANAALDQQCGPDGTEVRSGYNFYSISECVVAYFCNFYEPARTSQHHSIKCSSGERQLTSALIADKCSEGL